MPAHDCWDNPLSFEHNVKYVLTMSVSPADMLLFAAVVREGSFTRAARALQITKQTVSERIAKLERELGARLLERSTRSLRPTEVGRAYYERCAAIALRIEEANDEVQQNPGEPRGRLRISSAVLYGRAFLAPVVARYLRAYPRMRVEVVLANRRVNLVEEGFDVAIRTGRIEPASSPLRVLGDMPMHYVASPGLVGRLGTPTRATLRSFPCIGFGASETWEVDGKPAKVEPVLVVNDLEVACAAAMADAGIARLPALACRDAISDGRLRLVLGTTPVKSTPIYVLAPGRDLLPAKVKTFVDLLAQTMGSTFAIDAKRGTKRLQ